MLDTKINKKATPKKSKIIWIVGIFFFLFAFSFPLQSHAEQEAAKQENVQLPSLGGKLDLTPQTEEEISTTEKQSENNSLTTKKNSVENLANLQGITEQEAQTAKKAGQHRPATQKDVILAPGRYTGNSVIMEEDGSNVMIVHGTNKLPENYTNSTNINNGFYMNITNPDGSGMNMGTYFNSNSNSNYPRKQSKAQIVIDKME